MKLVSVGIATVGLFLLLALAPVSFRPQDAQAVLQQGVNQAAALKNAILHDVRKERRWMLLLGVTIVGYRLLRKHQALFESSYLYPGEHDFERRAFEADHEADLSLDTVPIERIAKAS